MIAEGSIVKGWAPSTSSKIVQLIDEFVINYPQARVRKTTTKLLASLFKKGNEEQRANIMNLLIERLQQLSNMGKASQDFLTVVTKIFELFPDGFTKEKTLIFNEVLRRCKSIFHRITHNKQYPFYSLCSNMIDFGQEFKPYLLQANGCLKCFGRPDVQFQQANFSSIREQLKVHLNTIEWVLKRRYEINNLQINFIKKKVNFKSLTIYYYDQNGTKKQLGKFTPNDNIPTFNVNTNCLGVTFEFNKIRRNHISCIVCSNNEQYAVLCSNCVPKIIDIEGSVKVVAGNPQKINKELTQAFKLLNQHRRQLQNFASSVENQSKITAIKARIVPEMETCYTGIIQNLRLLRNLSQSQYKAQRQRYQKYSTDCYSCHFFQFSACINFIAEILKSTNFKIETDELVSLTNDFNSIFFRNKVQSLNGPLATILSELFNRVTSLNYLKQILINKENSPLIVKLMLNLIQHIKVRHKDNEKLLEELKNYIFDQRVNKYFTIKDKAEIFVRLAMSEEQYSFISDEALEYDKLQDLKRLSIEQYASYKPLLDFEIKDVLMHNINNVFKLFLVLIPEEYIPTSSLDIVDAEYLKYIKNEPPKITQELIFKNIVFTPNPIIKLNLFKLLPQIIEQLKLQQSIELIRQLCKYKPLWNSYIRETVDNFDKMLESVEKERKLMLCLEGYNNSREDLYYQHIYKILTPQRPDFIIRLEIPEKEMQKEEKNKGGPVQYIYLPTRQVKSENLKSDTIGGLHEWISQEIRKMGQDMPFDLIVESNIIDNLDLSLQIIYKKIVKDQNRGQRKIGNKTYEFFRVIYRIQGIFGEANESGCGNFRDQKLEQCWIFSSNLLNRLPNRKTGLDVLMQIVPTLERKDSSKQKKAKMIKIIEIIFHNEPVVQKIVQYEYGNTILSMTVKSISLNKQDIRSTETLLVMCQKIISKANSEMIKIRKESGVFGNRRASQADMDLQADSQESQRAVKFVLEKVKEADDSGFKQISKQLIKMLPFCSKDDPVASMYLFEFFQVNKIFEINYSQKLTWFLQFMDVLSESYSSFKNICRQQGITEKMIQIISELSNLEKENIDTLEIGFTLCKGLVQGDMKLQEFLYEKGHLQEIDHYSSSGKLSQIGEEKKLKVGRLLTLLYEIIQYFKQGKMISQHVHEHFSKQESDRKKTRDQRLALKKKKAFTKTHKSVQSFQHLISKNNSKELIACSSCKEGYQNKRQILGVYLYSTKTEILPLESWWKDNKKLQAITSTSYFEPIHLECHMNAAKDDLKIQKSEWDGAIIRNSQVLCNNWCPFKGPQTTDQQFDKAVKKYFQKNNKNISFWVVINDLNGLLEKFTKQYNFAHETKGSSATHNAKLIPVIIELACHLCQNNDDFKYIKEGIAQIESNLTKKPNVVHLYFTLLLFNVTSSGFQTKKEFLLNLVDHLGYGNFKDSKPFYIQLALIEEILKIMRKAGDGSNVVVQLNEYIKRNFIDILQSLEVLADEYKNVYTRWENTEQAKQYFYK